MEIRSFTLIHKFTVNKSSVLSKAKDLLAKHELKLAKELLLNEGYILQLEPAIQVFFLKNIPPDEELIKQLNGPLGQLKNKDPKIRLEAARTLCKEVLKEWSEFRKAWLADPRAIDPLVAALGDSDVKVVEKAACALAATMRSYFADLRAFEPLLQLLKSPRKDCRLYAILGIGSVNHPDRWEVILDFLSDKAEEVRRGACRGLVDFLVVDVVVKPTTKRQLIARLEEMTAEKDHFIRAAAETVLTRLK